MNNVQKGIFIKGIIVSSFYLCSLLLYSDKCFSIEPVNEMQITELNLTLLKKEIPRILESGTTLLTFDANEKSDNVVSNLLNTDAKKAAYIMPVSKEKINGPLKKVYDYHKSLIDKTFKGTTSAKISAYIAVWTMGVDVFYWIHIGSLSSYQTWGNVVISLLTTIYLSIDKDSWGTLSKPFSNGFSRIFKRIGLQSNELRDSYFSSFSLSLALNLLRAPFIDANQLANHLIGSGVLSLSVWMSIIYSSAYFSWSAAIYKIDENVYPLAKAKLRILTDIRSWLVGTFASTVMVLNPNHFGYTPWLVIVSSGLGGVFIYFNLNRIIILSEKLQESYSKAKTKLFDSYNIKEKIYTVQNYNTKTCSSLL